MVHSTAESNRLNQIAGWRHMEMSTNKYKYCGLIHSGLALFIELVRM